MKTLLLNWKMNEHDNASPKNCRCLVGGDFSNELGKKQHNTKNDLPSNVAL